LSFFGTQTEFGVNVGGVWCERWLGFECDVGVARRLCRCTPTAPILSSKGRASVKKTEIFALARAYIINNVYLCSGKKHNIQNIRT
jgi:hypothetical protein